jgi:hypothetical protein
MGSQYLTIFRRRKIKHTGDTENRKVIFDASILGSYFSRPLHIAARELNVCSTALKK